MFNVKEHTKQITLVFRLKEIHMLHILVNICAYFRMTFLIKRISMIGYQWYQDKDKFLIIDFLTKKGYKISLIFSPSHSQKINEIRLIIWQ